VCKHQCLSQYQSKKSILTTDQKNAHHFSTKLRSTLLTTYEYTFMKAVTKQWILKTDWDDLVWSFNIIMIINFWFFPYVLPVFFILVHKSDKLLICEFRAKILWLGVSWKKGLWPRKRGKYNGGWRNQWHSLFL
jgi:hypothetical protein